MGTNFYVETDPCPHCGRSDGRTHIGKSSVGWSFYFAPARHLGIESWKAWRSWLSKPENRHRIVNEYGDKVTLSELVCSVENRPPDARKQSEDQVDAEGYSFSRTWDFS